MLDVLQNLMHISDVDQLGILLGLVGLEFILCMASGHRDFYSAKDSGCSLALGVFYGVVIALSAGVVMSAYLWVYSHRIVDLDWSSSVALILAAYVLVDFAFYWYHRAIHETRIGWAAHVVHHSSQFMNTGTALRSSFVEAWYEPLFLLPVIWLGVDPIMVVALISLNHLYQYWLHTRLIPKLGPLEWVFNTPSHHRVHHGSNLQYCDRNYGGTLIIWDRLFGSFTQEQEEPVYGIRHQLESCNPVVATTHEWTALAKDVAKAGSPGQVLGYLFMPPGWQPGDDSQTTRAQQRLHLGDPQKEIAKP